jgi:hypothetical protein
LVPKKNESYTTQYISIKGFANDSIMIKFGEDGSFDWNTFYLNLSLGGLQNCSFFQNEIGIVTISANVQINIISTID